MGKRGKESPKRKDGNQDPKDNQRQTDTHSSKQTIVKKTDRSFRNTRSSSKAYSADKSSPRVIISKEEELLAEEALRKFNSRKNHTECSIQSSASPCKQSSAKSVSENSPCKNPPKQKIVISHRTPKKKETPVPRTSPRRKLIPRRKLDPATSSQSSQSSKEADSGIVASVSRNRSRRKALVRAITQLRNQSKLKRRLRRPKPVGSSKQLFPVGPVPVKRVLRARKSSPAPRTEQKSVSVSKASASPTKTRKMDTIQENTTKVDETKSSSSNESSTDVQEEESTQLDPNNESDSDDVEMQVLEKQVLSDNEEDNNDDSTEPPVPDGSDEESSLLSPSALPASSLFRSPTRRKKRNITNLDQTPLSPPQTFQHSLPVATGSTSKPTTSYHSPYKLSLKTPFSKPHTTGSRPYPPTSTSYRSKLVAPSVPSQYPRKRGRGRPRKALEDVKSVSGKLYRKKLAERIGSIGVGRGRPIYSPVETAAAFPQSYHDDRSPYDDNFDDDPMAAIVNLPPVSAAAPSTTTTTTETEEDFGRRMQRWKNRSTFIYAKHKFRNNQDNEDGTTKDKFLCKVCKVGFTALSSLKRHYGTIYHKQQEQAGRSGVDFLATSPPSNRNPMNMNDFREFLPSSSSSSPSVGESRRGQPQRPPAQLRTSNIVRHIRNIRKYYATAAANKARREREGVDGVSGGTYINKRQRRKKPLVHPEYIYHDSLPASSMTMDDDENYLAGELELGEVRDEDAENNYPAEFEDLIRREEQAQAKSWLSNVWKGIGPPHFTCEFCYVSYENKREFTRHLFKHRQEESLTCPQCQLYFQNEAALENHSKLCCNGARSRFKCNMCTSTFSRLEYFKYHLEIHMRPPVRCPHCSKRFSHKFFLQDHIKSMHEWTDHNGHGNGLNTEILGPGSSATETALPSAVPVIGSPKPKIELFFPALPLISTDNRRKDNSNSSATSQTSPPTPASASSTKKRHLSKTSAVKAGSTSKITFSEDRDHDPLDLGDEGSSSSSSRPKECVNLFEKYFHEEKETKADVKERMDVDSSDMLPYVEHSTMEDGNLVWQFKPTFQSGLPENDDNNEVPSLTIEIPRDNIDFGEDEKGEGGYEKNDPAVNLKSHGKMEHETAGKNQHNLLEKVSSSHLQSPNPAFAALITSNLPLLRCGCKSNIIDKPLESPLVCQDCGKSFEHRKSLVKHVRYYSQSEDYNCKLCGKSFKLKHHVSRHMKSFHNVDNSSTSGAEDHSDMDALSSPSGSNSGGIMTPTEKESFSGVTFEGKFTSGTPPTASYSKRSLPLSLSKAPPKKIRKRLESSPAVPCQSSSSSLNLGSTSFRKKASSVTSEPGGSVSSTATTATATEGLFSATTVVDSDGISVFKCLICKKLYPSKTQLNAHIWYHKKKSSTIKLNCTKCPAKNFPNSKDLAKHMREKHDNVGKKVDEDEVLSKTDKIQVSRCPFCPLVFPGESDLKKHFAEHTSCIACRECGQVLGNKQQLLEHMENEHSLQEPKEEEEDEDDDDDESPPTPSPHTSPLHFTNFGRQDDDEEVDEEEEDDMQEDPESESELLDLN